MGWKGILEGIAGFLGGEATSFVRDLRKTADETLDHAEKRIEKMTKKALKAATVSILVILGFIFALVGVSKYITIEFALKDGMGFVIIGALLILLGWFAKIMRN